MLPFTSCGATVSATVIDQQGVGMKIGKTLDVTFRGLLSSLIYCLIGLFAVACAQTGAGGDAAGWVDEPAAAG